MLLLLLLLIQCYDAVLCCSQSTCFLQCLHRTVTMKLECWKTPRKVSVDKDWVIFCITWEVEGIRQRGRPKKTRWDCVKNDMESLGLSQKKKNIYFANSKNNYSTNIMCKHRGGFPEGQSPIVLDTLSNAEYNIKY